MPNESEAARDGHVVSHLLSDGDVIVSGVASQGEGADDAERNGALAVSTLEQDQKRYQGA